MKNQKELIHNEDWDILIILDACRFDYFKKEYKNYIDGDLIKVHSGAINTAEWLSNTFTEYYPKIKYISAMPHINSKGLSLKETNRRWSYDWKAVEHFDKIVDVWDFGWSDKLGIVPPKIVTDVNNRMGGDKKIIHYSQPHVPYISLTEEEGVKANKLNRDEKEPLKYFVDKIKVSMNRVLSSILKSKQKWKLADILVDTMDKPRAAGSMGMANKRKSVEYYYNDNLKKALNAVSLLNEISREDKKVCITADHGELLGESGYYGHDCFGFIEAPRIDSIINVPWLEVKK